MTDWRTLCAELTEMLNYINNYRNDWSADAEELINRARAALAESDDSH